MQRNVWTSCDICNRNYEIEGSEEGYGDNAPILQMDRRTPLESNVLHTNTNIGYYKLFNHKVINVVKNATIIGQNIDLIIISKELEVSFLKYIRPVGVK